MSIDRHDSDLACPICGTLIPVEARAVPDDIDPPGIRDGSWGDFYMHIADVHAPRD